MSGTVLEDAALLPGIVFEDAAPLPGNEGTGGYSWRGCIGSSRGGEGGIKIGCVGVCAFAAGGPPPGGESGGL